MALDQSYLTNIDFGGTLSYDSDDMVEVSVTITMTGHYYRTAYRVEDRTRASIVSLNDKVLLLYNRQKGYKNMSRNNQSRLGLDNSPEHEDTPYAATAAAKIGSEGPAFSWSVLPNLW